MTDNDIKKALECCLGDIPPCTTCKYEFGTNTVDECMGKLMQDALDLINRQQAEIERLNIRNKVLTEITKNYDWKFSKVKSEAIKEFAERLKAKGDRYAWVVGISKDEINHLVKEMTEGNENGKV